MTEEVDDDRSEQVRKHHEKWKKWKLELKMKDQEQKMKANETYQIGRKAQIGRPQDNARQYARKLIQKLQQPQAKACPISKNVADELQTNTCTICFQLMAPPNNPYILFPCGHNICKICLFFNGDKQLAKYELKIDKCPLCRVRITNQAENRNLMKLICSYMNKKELMERELEQEAKQKQEVDNITKLTQHCVLLDNEKKFLTEQLKQLKKSKKVMEEVIDRLLDQRKKCRRQFETLEDQSRLINRHVNEKQEEMDKIDLKIATLCEKQYTIQSTLGPLRVQKEKLQMDQAAKLIKGK